jgi:hypothetical protein
MARVDTQPNMNFYGASKDGRRGLPGQCHERRWGGTGYYGLLWPAAAKYFFPCLGIYSSFVVLAGGFHPSHRLLFYNSHAHIAGSTFNLLMRLQDLSHLDLSS